MQSQPDCTISHYHYHKIKSIACKQKKCHHATPLWRTTTRLVLMRLGYCGVGLKGRCFCRWSKQLRIVMLAKEEKALILHS